MTEAESLPETVVKLGVYNSKTSDQTEAEIKATNIQPTRNLLRL